MAKRHRDDWKHIRNLTWSEDQEFLDKFEDTMDDAAEPEGSDRRAPERPRPQADDGRYLGDRA